MGRIIAVDYGKKRVGVAATDELQMVANGLKTVPANEVMAFLKDYCLNEPVERFVVGKPTPMNNRESHSVRYIDAFVNSLKKAFPEKPVEIVDEHFTSQMAFQTMIDAGLKKKDRQNKALVDKISATIILQSYLERKGK